jgi:hypothetical protein
MSKFLRLAAVVLCVGVLAVGIVLFDLVGPLTYPRRGEYYSRASLDEELARTERLKRLREASHRRAEAKRQVATEVIARQRSLAEVLEQYRELNRQWPDIRTGFTKPEDLWMSEDEWDSRAVIEKVRQVLADRPDEADAVAGRLEMELQQLLADRKKVPPAPAEPRTERSR